MTKNIIEWQFSINQMMLTRNLDGISHEQTVISPDAGGSNLNWILGHIVSTRSSVLRLLGADALWSDEEQSRFRNGTRPTVDAAEAIALDRLMADFERSQHIVSTRLKELGDEELAREVDGKTLGEQLGGLAYHETYHVGQTAILRRVIGVDEG